MHSRKPLPRPRIPHGEIFCVTAARKRLHLCRKRSRRSTIPSFLQTELLRYLQIQVKNHSFPRWDICIRKKWKVWNEILCAFRLLRPAWKMKAAVVWGNLYGGFSVSAKVPGLLIGLILFLTSQISVQLSVWFRCGRLLRQLHKGHLRAVKAALDAFGSMWAMGSIRRQKGQWNFYRIPCIRSAPPLGSGFLSWSQVHSVPVFMTH